MGLPCLSLAITSFVTGIGDPGSGWEKIIPSTLTASDNCHMLFEVMKCLRQRNTVLWPQEDSKQTLVATCSYVPGDTAMEKLGKYIGAWEKEFVVCNLNYGRQEILWSAWCLTSCCRKKTHTNEEYLGKGQEGRGTKEVQWEGWMARVKGEVRNQSEMKYHKEGGESCNDSGFSSKLGGKAWGSLKQSDMTLLWWLVLGFGG